MHDEQVNTKIYEVTSGETKKSPAILCADYAPFTLVHTDLGLTDHDNAWTFLRGADGKERLLEGVEQVLRNIDLVQQPDRTKLLASAAEHYDMPYATMMGWPEQLSAGAVGARGGVQ